MNILNSIFKDTQACLCPFPIGQKPQPASARDDIES